DIGRLDARGQLVLSGRKKEIIVLPNGLNVFPEDIENALRAAGLRETVVLETAPGRIEAVVADPDAPPARPGDGRPLPERNPEEEAALRRRVEATVKRANASLGVHQRVQAWRLWPETDFPRTHTLKVKRDLVRMWADAHTPLAVGEERTAAERRTD
ncbi:MAG: hypothetical protein M3301_01015, partial [Chloroflexota bacterium]|nr:hypothetical protein [Chloroflexota bacterium]